MSVQLPNRQTLQATLSLVPAGTAVSQIRLTEVVLLASEWVGDESPYSQVVTVDGVTEYSKVDLQPSVEQLEVFHDKDIAFSTENEDGVITVYAIGDTAQDHESRLVKLEK